MTPEQSLHQTPLHAKHVALEAKMEDVAGWHMPLSYGSALEEAHEARSRAVVWDVSHMGRLRIRGDGAIDLLERACTVDVAHQEDDTCVITPLCNERGGLLDLCRLVRLEDHWLLFTSPLGREKILSHLQGLAEALNAKVEDQTGKTALFDVAGPAAAKILDAVLPQKVSEIPAGGAATGSFMIAKYVATRMDFTGLWSLQVVVPAMLAGMAWDFITKKAGANAIRPAGLAARDILRLEAAIPEYGYEINETIDPFTAGLGAAVRGGRNFIGSGALEEIKRRGVARRLVAAVFDAAPTGGTAMLIPRQGEELFDASGAAVGTITSATFSPALERIVALAYVSAGAGAGTRIQAGPSRLGATLTDRPVAG